MTRVHIHRVRAQPATRFRLVANHPAAPIVKNPAGRCLWTKCCNKRRPAKNLEAHAYYDGTWFFCVPGKGCKRAGA